MRNEAIIWVRVFEINIEFRLLCGDLFRFTNLFVVIGLVKVTALYYYFVHLAHSSAYKS